ncbi:uncharacterized protein LOC120942940 isoform X2 [Rana temporaria]|uniref:uncharacterized protein LOC120942940 isoform X2 n=1 Tax=Rana temporaria TaxID=8407 RepID=UPI001AAE1799|nr:uncharacterized protein LOC120942940 isoform X2 [Rana temporaria]
MMSLFTVIWSHLSKVARFCYDMTLGFLLTVARFCYDMTLGFLLKMSLFTVIWSFLSKVARFCYDMTLGFLLEVARFCYDMTLGFLLKMSLFTVIWSFLSKVAQFCYDMTLGFLLEIMNIPEKINSAVQRLVPGRTIRKRVVGLFSREAEDSYHFLREALRFHDVLVREVRTFTITNNGGSRFRDEVSQCDFAILYHSKKRGRLNITDVTDSIYDEELKHLSKTLGKENVLVVADDLDSTTQGDKAKILNSQPLIQERARDLILFRSDKNTYNKETQEKINKILSHIG